MSDASTARGPGAARMHDDGAAAVSVTAQDVVITPATPFLPPPGQPPAMPAPGHPAAPVPDGRGDSEAPDDGGSYEIRVECPGCGTVWEGNDIRPHAEWFCGNCDYPLFWALPGASAEAVEGDGAFARLPGTDGRAALTSLACPTCGERNPPVPTANCLRCGNPLTPPGAPLPLPQPTVVHIPVETVVPASKRRIWPWVVAACVFAAAFVITLIILLND